MRLETKARSGRVVEILARLERRALLGLRELPDQLAQLERLAQTRPLPAPLGLRVLLGQQGMKALLASTVRMARPARPELQAQLEQLDPLVQQVRREQPELPEPTPPFLVLLGPPEQLDLLERRALLALLE